MDRSRLISGLAGLTGLVGTLGLATAAQAAPLSVGLEPHSGGSTPIRCLFDDDCVVTADDTIDTITTTGGFLQSRRFPVGQAGTVGEGLHPYLYRVDLRGAVGVLSLDCVTRIDIPFGKIMPLDYDGDGTAEDIGELNPNTSIGNVHIASAEQLDDTVRIHFAGSGVCQGAFSGGGDSSFFFVMASQSDTRFDTSEVDFVLASGQEDVAIRVPDVPETSVMEDYAFAWADQSSTGVYTPSLPYAYNRAGGGIEVERNGVGDYRVTFEGMDTLWNVAGNAQVTAYGSESIDTVHCNTPGWSPDAVDVQCFDETGQRTDARFTVLLAKPMPIREGVAYVRADQPSTIAYTADPEFAFNPAGGTPTISRTSTGNYSVTFPGFGSSFEGGTPPGGGGTVQVTSMNSGNARCRVSSWSHSSGLVSVRCLDTTGAPLDAEFSLLFLRPDERFDRDVAYAWANDLANASYEPSSAYASNPADDGVFATHSTTGRYVVNFEELAQLPGTTSGHVQATPYGTGVAHCGILGWSGDTSTIDCFAPNGTAEDARFTVLRLEPTAVPEPAFAMLLATGGVFAVLARRART